MYYIFTEQEEKMKRHIQIIPLKEEEFPLIDELTQNYLRDLSKFSETLVPDSSGRFDTSYFKTFIPLVFRMDGDAMIVKGKAIDYIINDFYISPEFRRQGLGARAVEQLFASHPGSYGFHVLEKNRPALTFWRTLFERNGFTAEETAVIDNGERVIKMIGKPHRVFTSSRNGSRFPGSPSQFRAVLPECISQ